YTAGQRVIGRGVKVGDVKTESPLYVAGVRPGDTLLEVENQRIGNPEELVNALAASDRHPARVKAFRYDWPLVFKVEKGKLLAGNTDLDELGIQSWSRDRSWRASGFYGHYVTYAEVLQLILALALALFISLPSKRTWSGVLLLVAFAGFGFALLLTMTRAAWLAFLISSTVIILLGAGRRGVIVVGALAIPLILAGLFILQQKRNVGFFDSSEGSTTWRITVWREGVNLLTSKPRHLLFGIGMDSLKGHWREWGMFDHGRLPIGHMHSNLLQIALERGIPALLVWLLLLGAYARMLWQLSRKLGTGATDEAAGASGSLKLGTWVDRGLTLGALGGLVGFFVSGLVHYNWGDSEVVMIFYFIMGLALVLNRMVADGQSFGRRASNSHKAS
ncbi:MAG TPA: O-antigen ligase family protein, partial [Pyrinomonadaceae bacterium]|nr:O-antigen ligase family protein [Pyrinomonadaceae bacterium]